MMESGCPGGLGTPGGIFPTEHGKGSYGLLNVKEYPDKMGTSRADTGLPCTQMGTHFCPIALYVQAPRGS